jgi:hypothetical protein
MGVSGKSRSYILLGVLLVLATAVIFWMQNRPGHSSQAAPNKSSSHSEPAPPAPRSHDRPEAKEPSPDSQTASPSESAPADPNVIELIRASLEQFRNNTDPGKAREILTRLREGIRLAREDEAAAAVLAFLKTGDDASTGLGFIVGPDGIR